MPPLDPTTTRRLLLRAQRRGDGHQVISRDFQVPAGRPVSLGREPRPQAGAAGDQPDYGAELVFTDDFHISNNHVTLTWDGSRLRVVKRPQARNPVFVLDRDNPGAARPADDFTVGLLDRFRIGNTVFTLLPDTGPIERTVSGEELERLPFVDPTPRIEALLDLPRLIDQSPDGRRLDEELLRVVLRGVPRAEAVAVVAVAPGPDGEVTVRAHRFRAGPGGVLTPSRQLVHRAVRGYENVRYVWPMGGIPGPDGDCPTVTPGTDWAMCVPLMCPRDEGLYITGRMPSEVRLTAGQVDAQALDADLKFAKLAGDITSSLRTLVEVQRRETFLAQLLTPVVRTAIADRPVDEVTAPRELPVTVLFCDLRGSVEAVEGGKADLMAALNRVSAALDEMTDAIVQFDGVIGDFQGDAAMGFWGWPLAQDDQIERACRAALRIRKVFADHSRQGDPNARFVCGLGVAHGPGVAGKLGTRDQAKIGVFGPVVNRAARLEAATKRFGVQILVDEAVIARLGGATWCRVRQVARVRLQGMPAAVQVGELLPPETERGPNLSESHRRRYEAALARFQAGDWAGFRAGVADLSNDGPAEFVTQFIDRFPDGRPPAGWDGGIPVAK